MEEVAKKRERGDKEKKKDKYTRKGGADVQVCIAIKNRSKKRNNMKTRYQKMRTHHAWHSRNNKV